METFVFSSWCERILDGEVGDWSKSLIENSVGGCSSGFVSIFVLNLVVLCSYKMFGVCEVFLLSYFVDKSIFLIEPLIYSELWSIYFIKHPPGYLTVEPEYTT